MSSKRTTKTGPHGASVAAPEDSVRPDGVVRRVLLVTPECAPYAKIGGLADVVPALAKALVKKGIDARIVLPLYGQVDRQARGLRPDGACCVHMGMEVEHWIGVETTTLAGTVPVWFVDFGAYFNRHGVYGDGSGEFGDNVFRFALLCKAALQLCKDRAFIPDVMHLHDWPAALGAVLLKTWDRIDSPLSQTASVVTIHNIGHQGKFPAEAYPYFGVGGEHFNGDTFEDFGRLNLLKAGIRFADGITTVSPGHLNEILSPEGGHGLAPYLNNRRADVTGILNGVDYDIWSPERDALIPAPYDARDLSGKMICKETLQKYLGLHVDPDLPLFGIVTRLVLQKGIDLLQHALPRCLRDMQMQFVVLGSGEPYYEDFVRWICGEFPRRAAGYIGFSDELCHLIEAGADFFLMPSLYEPCGLNQIYSLKYGTLPVVRATGGLLDTVENYDEPTGGGTGFVFSEPSPDALYNTMGWAVSTWFDRPRHIERLRQQAMRKDFSWNQSAEAYIDVYQRAMGRRHSWA